MALQGTPDRWRNVLAKGTTALRHRLRASRPPTSTKTESMPAIVAQPKPEPPYASIQAINEHTRWVFEREEARSSGTMNRTIGLMSVSATLLALLPVITSFVSGINGDAKHLSLGALWLTILCLVISLLAGLVAVWPRKYTEAPYDYVYERWEKWLLGGRKPLALEVYRDFTGAILDSDIGREFSPLQTQRVRTDVRQRAFRVSLASFGWAAASMAVFAVTTTGAKL